MSVEMCAFILFGVNEIAKLLEHDADLDNSGVIPRVIGAKDTQEWVKRIAPW